MMNTAQNCGIGVFYGLGGFGAGHTGIVYVDASGQKKMLHLCSHHKLKSEVFDDDYLEFCIKTSEEVGKQLLAIIIVLAEFLPEIPYGVGVASAAGSFVSGRYIKPDLNDGLTCATFVTTLFSDYKFPLVQVDTWECSSEGEEWGRLVLKNLQAKKVDEQHIERVLNNLNGVRVRPDEVAGAASMTPDVPIEYETAKIAARNIVEKYAEYAAAKNA